MTEDIRDAAAIILWRKGPRDSKQIYLQRRTSGASFMANASVFPGGARDPNDSSLKYTAIRELFEEAGILFINQTSTDDERAQARAELLGGGNFNEILNKANWTICEKPLKEYSSWITPSVERKRFKATFFIAELPQSQTPTVDDNEAVHQEWLSPEECVDEACGLYLPPPQLLTLYQLNREPARFESEEAPDPVILPRALSEGSRRRTLLFPWDRNYSSGVGEAIPWTHPRPPWPSRVNATATGWSLGGD